MSAVVDATLRDLVDRVEHGEPSVIGIYLSLTSGTIIAGVVTEHAAFARLSQETASTQVKQELRGRRGQDDERFASWEADARPIWELLERANGENVLTVTEAKVTLPSGATMKVPAARVELTQVAAWWVTTTE